jgi:hypothetical protein
MTKTGKGVVLRAKRIRFSSILDNCQNETAENQGHVRTIVI